MVGGEKIAKITRKGYNLAPWMSTFHSAVKGSSHITETGAAQPEVIVHEIIVHEAIVHEAVVYGGMRQGKGSERKETTTQCKRCLTKPADNIILDPTCGS